MISFALLLDQNKFEFKKILKMSKEYFNLKPNVISSNIANAYEMDNQILVSFHKNKIHFQIAHLYNDNSSNAVNKVKDFIVDHLNNETVGIKYYQNIDATEFDDIKNVHIINLQ